MVELCANLYCGIWTDLKLGEEIVVLQDHIWHVITAGMEATFVQSLPFFRNRELLIAQTTNSPLTRFWGTEVAVHPRPLYVVPLVDRNGIFTAGKEKVLHDEELELHSVHHQVICAGRNRTQVL